MCGIFRIFEVRLGYHLIIGPFILGMALPLGFFLHLGLSHEAYVFFEFTYKFPEEETHQLKSLGRLKYRFNDIEWAKSNWLESRNYYVQKILGSGFFLLLHFTHVKSLVGR
jgi:hypothetical protein